MKKFKEMTEEEVLDRVIEIHEVSVRATHDFFTEEDISYNSLLIRKRFPNLRFDYCLDSEDGYLVGFMTVIGRYILMLYVHPDYFGQGFEQQLLDKALNEYRADTVYVYEQDTRAQEMYKKRGFVVEKREEEEGAYPMLCMRLENPALKMVKVVPDMKKYNELLEIRGKSSTKEWDALHDCEVLGFELDGLPFGVIAVSEEGQIVNYNVSEEGQKQSFDEWIMSFLIENYNERFRWLRIDVSGDLVPYFRSFGFKREKTEKDYFRYLYPRSRRIHRRLYDEWDLVHMRLRVGK